jgi:hypothetical protein
MDAHLMVAPVDYLIAEQSNDREAVPIQPSSSSLWLAEG